MKLEGKRIAILAENMYQEMELWVPYYRLREEGADVKVIGAGGAKSYTSKHGYPVNVDAQAEQVKAVEFDAVIVPGGYAPDMMRRHAAMVGLVREAAQQGKVVAAICHAGWMLVSAGILEGRKATSFFSIKDDLVAAGCDWKDAGVGRGAPLGSSRLHRPPHSGVDGIRRVTNISGQRHKDSEQWHQPDLFRRAPARLRRTATRPRWSNTRRPHGRRRKRVVP
ncbi:MAG: hypothetical protein DME02_18350 [Candidatus Rokuibacteriota bacterium]|nr:MAG: hypothetical protein DME02_18350 [Candidatus Rokubacteria bacterium]